MAKPAVLVVTLWKIEAIILSGRERAPTVSGFLYSKMKKSKPPDRMRVKVTLKAIFVFTVSREKDLLPIFLTLPKALARSSHTIKPMPPKMMSSAVVKLTTGFAT